MKLDEQKQEFLMELATIGRTIGLRITLDGSYEDVSKKLTTAVTLDGSDLNPSLVKTVLDNALPSKPKNFNERVLRWIDNERVLRWINKKLIQLKSEN